MTDVTTTELTDRWRAGPISAQVVRAIGTVGVLSMVARLAMAGRDIALANKFGTNAQVDAFVVALILPLFGTQIISGSLPTSLIPTFTAVDDSEGRAAASRVLRSSLAMYLAITLLVSGILAVTMPIVLHVIASGFDAPKLALTRSLVLILLPMMTLGTLSVTWGALLNVEHRFALPAATPALAPLVALAVLTLGPSSWGMRGVAWGMTIGAALEALLLGIAVGRRGLPVVPRWSGYDVHQRAVARQWAPAAAGTLLLSSTVVVDQAVAAAHSSGSVAILNYGGKVVSFLVGIGTVAIGSVVLPHVSAIAARQDWAGIRRTMRSYVGYIAAVSIPITLCAIVLSRPIVDILFVHGAFTAHDARTVSQVQALYLLQIPFYMVAIVGVRTLAALKRNQVLALITGGMVVANLVTDLMFVHLFGIPGIALSTSCVYVCSSTAVFVATAKILRAREQESV